MVGEVFTMMRLSWLISTGIALFGVMLIEHFFTMKLEDEALASGNLGAVGIALVAPFILLSLFTTFRYFSTAARLHQDALMRSIYIGFGIALCLTVTYFAIDYKNNVFESLGGTTKNPASSIYGYPFLNEYTNSVYINFYTFIAVHSAVAVLSAIYGIFSKGAETQNEEKNEHNG